MKQYTINASVLEALIYFTVLIGFATASVIRIPWIAHLICFTPTYYLLWYVIGKYVGYARKEEMRKRGWTNREGIKEW